MKMPWSRAAVRVLPAKIDCSLKAEAFQVLAELKSDPDAEAFFIDYFVSLEEPLSIHSSAQDHLTELAHSFWG